MEKEILNIGTLTIEYSEDGKFGSAQLNPVLKIEMDEETIKEIQQVKCHKDNEIIKNGADIIMASMFSRVNEIELTDRLEYKLESVIKECDKWHNGNVKKCVIEYSFVKY